MPCSTQRASTHAWESLPPCPVPLYYFPKPYPFSHNPVVSSALPRQLTLANRDLRVRIPDPWAQSLQVFVSETPPAVKLSGNAKSTASAAEQHPNLQELRQKTYAAYTIYNKPGVRHTQTIVPPGSTFDFAWTMFTKFFKVRTGAEWTELHGGWKAGKTFENMLEMKLGGGEADGASDHQRWDMREPPVFLRHTIAEEEATGGSTGAQERRPCVTVVMNTAGLAATDHICARAKTPEAGW
jgi:hypothetical protein